jgi:hypothetical protein
VLGTGKSSIFSMFWMQVFTGMTMLTASLRLRHGLRAEVARFNLQLTTDNTAQSVEGFAHVAGARNKNHWIVFAASGNTRQCSDRWSFVFQ